MQHAWCHKKKSPTCLAVLALILVMIGSSTIPLYAAIITATEDATKFGNLDQAFTNCSDISCGPTAAVNSFVYLQNMFARTYDKSLVGTPTLANMTKAADDLGMNFMKTCCGDMPKGTLIEDFILGKKDYIESKDKGATKYAAQLALAWDPNPPNGKHPGTAKPSFVTDTKPPTVDFIANEITAGEDVEAFIAGPAGRHYLTLTGIMFDTTSKAGKLSIVDPTGGGRDTIDITGLDGAMLIHVTYKGNDFAIGNVVAESPIPEPSSLLLFASGIVSLLCGRKLWLRKRMPQVPPR
jgi:hypothetical protein